MAISINAERPWWETDRFIATRVSPDDPPQVWRETALPWEVEKTPLMYITDTNDRRRFNVWSQDFDPEHNVISTLDGVQDRMRNLQSISRDSIKILANDTRLNGVTVNGRTTLEQSPKFAIYRNDTGHLLGLASNRYHVHSMDDLCDAMAIVCAAGGYKMSSIGSLKNGAEIWFMAQTHATNNICGEPFKRNVVLSTSFDQSKVSLGYCTDIAVVCNNTLQFSLQHSSNLFRFSHLQAFDPENVVGNLQAVAENQDNQKELLEQLADHDMKREERIKFFRRIADLIVPATMSPYAKRDKELNRISDDFEATYLFGPGGEFSGEGHRRRKVYGDGYGIAGYVGEKRDPVPSRIDTRYGALQAVSRYVDYEMLTTQKGLSKANRFQRAFVGDGRKVKDAAINNLLLRAA
tara:strand:- start:933 stop:2153 length:1221 start_codon:yes stop_codon:yes gene_type:complete